MVEALLGLVGILDLVLVAKETILYLVLLLQRVVGLVVVLFLVELLEGQVDQEVVDKQFLGLVVQETRQILPLLKEITVALALQVLTWAEQEVAAHQPLETMALLTMEAMAAQEQPLPFLEPL